MTSASNPLAAAPAANALSPPRSLGGASKQIEAVFLRQLIAAMRAPSLGTDVMASDGPTPFRDMSDARLAEAMAGKFGIAALLEKQFEGAPK